MSLLQHRWAIDVVMPKPLALPEKTNEAEVINGLYGTGGLKLRAGREG